MAILLFTGSLCQFPLFMLATWATEKNSLDELACRASRRRHRDWISMARKVAESFSLCLFFSGGGELENIGKCANFFRQLWGAYFDFWEKWKSWWFNEQPLARCWFQIFILFIPTWGDDPIWRAYFSIGLKLNHQLEQDNSLPTSIFYGIC